MKFRHLTEKEKKDFQKYAQENDPPNLKAWFTYHPVCREIWIKRGIKPLTLERK